MKFSVLIFLTLTSLAAEAGREHRQKAVTIHNRIAGVPPSAGKLNQMEAMLIANDHAGAVALAMEHKGFLNTVVKNWLKPWTNVTQTTRDDLNDFVATGVGLIRDDEGFDQLLHEDVIYLDPTQVTPNEYKPESNAHYVNLEAPGRNVNWANAITRNTQSATNTNLSAASVAGAITTRAFGQAYFAGGTNRRMTRYLFMNFLCNDFEQVSDTSIADFRVRQDIERAPGGDSRIYKNTCVGCHAGQDALGGAFAYYNFLNNRVVHSPGDVRQKVLRNAHFYPEGYVTINDSWINLWAQGQNARLGWDANTPISGNGAKSLGLMLSKSKAFRECMAQKSWELLCLKKMKPEEASVKAELAEAFGNSGHNIKQLFAETLNRCVINE